MSVRVYRDKFCLAFLIFILVASGPVIGQEKVAATDLEIKARNLVDNLRLGKYDLAGEHFDETMKKQATPAFLKMVWEGLLTQVGVFKEVGEPRFESKASYDFVYLPCVFEKQILDIRVVFNSRGEIAGFSFVPHLEVKESPPPAYASPKLFEEQQVEIKTGEWVLPGTLTRPKGQGPFPAVVLVHGSGPNDRDESIGPNKPFRDIAWGLASQGIAVLRYDKRTKVYGQKIASELKLMAAFTVDDETVADAISAAELLRLTSWIDPKKVFILGHSLGGMLIPRIALRDEKAAGFIILAGLTRPLEDTILEQTKYLLALQGTLTEEGKKRLGELEKVIARIKSLTEADRNSTEVLLGASPAYWLDLRGYNPAEEARKIDRPLLILQGKRDYQVTEVDFNNWKKALSEKKNVAFKIYPACNHLFIEGKGLITPDEYLYKAGNVSEEVINDIAAWIKSIK
ncbi:MAG: alpha/beta fold hydrolase [Candidatus Saccharicenans sp.]|nr:alpha/beta fold hydrolase [Candidatus Saccharicenans sp.]